MKTKIIAISVLSFLVTLGCRVYGDVSVNIVSNDSTGLYLTSSLGSMANFAYEYGYLDENAYDSLGLNQLDFNSVDNIFNTIGSGLFNADGTIFSTGNSVTIPAVEEPQVGSNLYMWVFDSSDPSTSSEWGLFGSSNWLMPPDLASVSLTSNLIDNVVFGDVSGNNFITSPVPEPSTYALLAGILSIGYVVVRRSRSRA